MPVWSEDADAEGEKEKQTGLDHTTFEIPPTDKAPKQSMWLPIGYRFPGLGQLAICQGPVARALSPVGITPGAGKSLSFHSK
jgi:hypothetical protein